MNSNRPRRPQQRGVVVPQHEQERMQQVLQRLKSALQLGLKPASPEKEGGERWCSSDAEVQLQALRAISAFVLALTSYPGRPALLRVPLEDSVASLASLLGAERENVYTKAAEITAALVAVMGDGLVGNDGKLLVGPLAHLLNCAKLSISIASATALRGILLKIKLGSGFKASEESTWKALEDADVLRIINRFIQEDEGNTAKDVAILELSAVIVERWPEARYRKASSFGASFTGPHVAAIAAGCLRALESGKSSDEGKWFPEVEYLFVEAAHATSSILSWPGQHHSSFLRNGIEELLLAALSGARNKKSGPGDDQPTKTAAGLKEDRRSRAKKLNPRLRPLLWEILGWLGAHHCVDGRPSSSPANTGLGKSNSNLFVLACTSLLTSLCKRGQSPVLFKMEHTQDGGTDSDGKSQEEQPVSAQEVIQISKAVFLLLSSPSPAVSSQIRLCLEDALSSHGIDWLPSLVKTTALGVSKTVKIDNLQLVTNLLAVACVSWAEECRDQLLKVEVLKIVLDIIQGQAESVDQVKIERLSAMRASVHPARAKTCCFDADSWEGNDSVLFTALCALPKLLQGSQWVKNIRESMSQEILEQYCRCEEGDFVYMLWKLANDRNRADGVRWWSVCSLANFGIYGFPSRVGQDFKRCLDDPSLADLIFVLSDGRRIPAHGVMLAARCETLLPAQLQAKVCVNLGRAGLHQSKSEDSDFQNLREVDMELPDCVLMSTPAEVLVSSRLTSRVLRILLEYVYAGVVCIPSALMAEIKVVAKRCRMEPLTSLLEGKNPVWGQPSAPCDLERALGMKGYALADVLLVAWKSQGRVRTEEATRAASEYLRAHRLVLSARCQYFQALFRSGMRDSTRKILEMQASNSSIMKLLPYLYSGPAKSEVVNCAWINLAFKAQFEYLQSLLELADLAGQWLLDELQQLTCDLIGMYLRSNILLCPPTMSMAAAGQLWTIVETCAACLAPVYIEFRDSGVLDSLNEDLTDFVRVAHVKLFLSGKLGDGRLG